MRTAVAVLALLAVSLAGPVRADQDDDRPVARLVHRSGQPDPGGTLLLQVKVRWDGRPERHLPGRPTVAVPRDATVRIGQTASRFDGEGTRWWTDVVVELPDRGGPWVLGPATVPLKGGRLAGTRLETAALELGEPSLFRQLLSQGVGNGAVVVAILLWLGWRWRGLAPAPIPPERTRVDGLLLQARSEEPEACLATLLEVRLALAALGVDDPAPPDAEALRQRLEAARFGGESIGRDECRKLLTAIEAVFEEAR